MGLVYTLLSIYLLFHIVGVWYALGILLDTIAVEKLAKKYGLDYNIRYKGTMFLMCIVFSWLAFSALKKCQKAHDE